MVGSGQFNGGGPVGVGVGVERDGVERMPSGTLEPGPLKTLSFSIFVSLIIFQKPSSSSALLLPGLWLHQLHHCAYVKRISSSNCRDSSPERRFLDKEVNHLNFMLPGLPGRV